MRLIECNLLPLAYRREIADIVFFLKSTNGDTGFDINKYVKFVDEGAERETREIADGTKLKFRDPKWYLGKHTNWFPRRIIRIWNNLPKSLRGTLKPLNAPMVIKQFVIPHYFELLSNTFDPDDSCTWSIVCGCARCRPC